MKASVEAIRAAGFEWPKLDEIGRRLVLDGEQIDLDATREGIEVAAAYYRRQLDEMQSFSDTWDAPMSDVSDRREEYTTRERELVAAAAYLSEVISGLASRGPVHREHARQGPDLVDVPARPPRDSVRSSRTAPRARSQEELDLYAEHRACERCGSVARDGKLDYIVDVDGDVATLEYEGRCGQCGNALKFSVDAPVKWATQLGFAYGGADPSELFSPDELLAIAESLAGVPDSPSGLDVDTYFRHNGNLVRAVALFEEVAKFIPPGSADVPLARLTREVRELLARYTAVNAEMNARDKARPKAPKGNFTREALEAHEQWIARGRTGAGRFSVENARVGALRLGTVKLAGARLVKVNLDRAHADFGDFSGAELIDCTATSANFAHSVFDGAQLLRCDFSEAHLGLTDFRDGVVTEGRFVAASADRAAWNRIRITGADLRELRFGDCVLDGAVLDGCDLRDASFDCVTPALDTLCSTMNTTFVRCDLRGASFEGRRLDGTRFIDCTFAGVKGRPRIEAPYVVERPDFSAAGDGSDIRGGDAVRTLWGG